MAGDDAGGSFWATFGGGTDGAEVSALEKLLQTPNCSVEALLDEEEVIQEFKTGNPNLVTRLSQPDAIKVLMECITEDPPAEASHARCYRYPFVAVELMTCAPPKFLELLVSAESKAMDFLWSFLTRDPKEVNPVLAGYFSRTATALMSKYNAEVLDYLRSRGPEQLLQEFLDRIHLRSLAELLARLLSGESEKEVVFQTSDIVARFVSRWQEDSNSDAQENLTLVLAELLNQKDSLFWIEDLTQQLTEPSTVQFLIDHIFTQPAGVPPAMSLLTTVIVHTSAGLKDGEGLSASTPSLSPLAPPRLAEEMPAVNLDEPVVGEAAPAKVVPTPQSTLQSTTSEWMERRRNRLMREVAGHFPSFRQLLDVGLQKDSAGTLAMPQGSIKALGGTTLEVISLITTLSRSGMDVILEAMLKNQLLPRCLQVFFQHPWSSLLHNCVKQLVVEVLSGSDALRQQLSRQLLKEASLAERIVEEYKAEAEWKTKKQKHARVGYMGHLFLMSSALNECKSPEVIDLLAATSGWSDVVLQLEATKKLHNEQLGGGVPASDRGLASSQRTTSERESEGDQVAACPAWVQRVTANFLAAEPVDLQGVGDHESPTAPNGDAAIPNGQGSSPSSPSEDAFNPDFATFGTGSTSTPNSGHSWATFPEVAAPASPGAAPGDAPGAAGPAPGGFPEPSFAAFATEWPSESQPAQPSSSWAAFQEPPATPPPSAPNTEERLQFDSPLSMRGGGGSQPSSAPPSTPPPGPPPGLPAGAPAQAAQPFTPFDVPQREVEKAAKSPASPAPKAPSAPLSEELGAENLFALIGEGFAPRSSPSRPEMPHTAPPPKPAGSLGPATGPMGPPFQAISTVPKQPSAGSSPWPSVPATPWSTPSQGGGYGMGPPPGPVPSIPSPVPGSWIGDFDPLADSKGTPPASKVPPSAPSASSELAFLDFQWPSSATSH